MNKINTLASWFFRYDLWILAPIIFIGVLVERLHLLAAASLMISIAAWLAWKRQAWPRSPANPGIAILVVILALNLVISPVPDLSLTQAYRIIIGIGLFYLISARIKTEKHIRLAINGLALTGLVLVVTGLFSVEWSLSKLSIIPDSFYQMISSPFVESNNPNVIAGFLLLLLPVVITPLIYGTTYFNTTDKFEGFLNPLLVRLLCASSAIAMFAMLILVKSRGALVSLVSLLLVFVVLRWRWGWLPVVLVIIALVVPLSQEISLVRFLNTSSNSLDTFSLREEIWSRGLLIVEDYPLTGVGLGSFGAFVDSIYPLFSVKPGLVPHAHNLYLQLAVDLGIPGLITWLDLLIIMIVASWMIYNSGQTTPWLLPIGAGFLSSSITLAIHGLFDAVTWGMVRPAPIVWALWGLTNATLTLSVKNSFKKKTLILPDEMEQVTKCS